MLDSYWEQAKINQCTSNKYSRIVAFHRSSKLLKKQKASLRRLASLINRLSLRLMIISLPYKTHDKAS